MAGQTLYSSQWVSVENTTYLGVPAWKKSANFVALTGLPVTYQNDVRRQGQAKYFAEPETFLSTMKGNLLVTGTVLSQTQDVQRQRQAKFFQEPDFFVSTQKSFVLVTLAAYPPGLQQFTSQTAIVVENLLWTKPQRGSLNTLGLGPIAPQSSDIYCGQDTYGWPPESADPPTFPKTQAGAPLVYNNFVVYNPANDFRRPQAKYFEEPASFPLPQRTNPVLLSFLAYNPTIDVIWRKSQARWFQEPETFVSTMPRFAGSGTYNYTIYNPAIDVQRARQARYFVDPDIFLRPAPFSAIIINGTAGHVPVPCVTNKWLDIYDDLNGSFQLAWAPMLSPDAQSYNVYVNGTLYASVAAPGAGGNWTTTISGFQTTTYNAAVVAPTPANGPRPQNMPPTGTVTNSGTYDIKVVAVYSGIETTSSLHRMVTVNPTSIMLKTPMKRLWPFPNTGLD
jgi:hypothetical protein